MYTKLMLICRQVEIQNLLRKIRYMFYKLYVDLLTLLFGFENHIYVFFKFNVEKTKFVKETQICVFKIMC